MVIQSVPLKKIKPNPKNPRLIKDEKFRKLVDSIRDFPEMLEKRPLVCYTDTDGKFVVLGGNMRLKAAKEVGLKEIPVTLADDWTEEKRNEFLIRDNIGFGEWDWESLANEWEMGPLSNWGLDVPKVSEINYSAKNQEIDFEDLDTDMEIKLKFSEEDYWRVKDRLQSIAKTNEEAVLKLLFNE
jgi:hypothetical protein